MKHDSYRTHELTATCDELPRLRVKTLQPLYRDLFSVSPEEGESTRWRRGSPPPPIPARLGVFQHHGQQPAALKPHRTLIFKPPHIACEGWEQKQHWVHLAHTRAALGVVCQHWHWSCLGLRTAPTRVHKRLDQHNFHLHREVCLSKSHHLPLPAAANWIQPCPLHPSQGNLSSDSVLPDETHTSVLFLMS